MHHHGKSNTHANRPRLTTHENERTNHNSLSKQSMLKQSQEERKNDLVTKIMKELNRLSQSDKQTRIISKEMLKEGGSKLFYDVFAILSKEIDL